jgi:hypothetical protein
MKNTIRWYIWDNLNYLQSGVVVSMADAVAQGGVMVKAEIFKLIKFWTVEVKGAVKCVKSNSTDLGLIGAHLLLVFFAWVQLWVNAINVWLSEIFDSISTWLVRWFNMFMLIVSVVLVILAISLDMSQDDLIVLHSFNDMLFDAGINMQLGVLFVLSLLVLAFYVYLIYLVCWSINCIITARYEMNASAWFKCNSQRFIILIMRCYWLLFTVGVMGTLYIVSMKYVMYLIPISAVGII